MKKRVIAAVLALTMLFGTVSSRSITAYAGEEHRHTEDCYACEGDLLCTIPEDEGHTHSESCICPGGELLCEIPESEGHAHGEECYAESRELTCVIEESLGHVHSEDCYAEENKLICESEEYEGHTHDEACADENGEWICARTESEGHSHSEVCFETERLLVCETPEEDGHLHTEVCFTAGEPERICEKEETEGHAHDEDCFCPGGERICGEEEREGHSHSEECFATGDELICGLWESEPEAVSISLLTLDDGITTAEQLKDAIENAESGDSFRLDGDITYSWNTLGSIEVSVDVTLDFNGYKITVDDALFEIASTGSLTLKNTQIETTSDDVIDYNYGSVIIESTAGTGIVSADDFISENHGQLTVKDGSFTLYYSLIYENYGSARIVIENAAITTENNLFGSIYGNGCSLIVKNGSFTFDDGFVSEIEGGRIVIENGTFIGDDYVFGNIKGSTKVDIVNGVFTTESDIIDSICDEGCMITIKGGTFTGGYSFVDDTAGGTIVIENGSFYAGQYLFDDITGNTDIQIADGTFSSGSDDCDATLFYLGDNAKVAIAGGSFSSFGKVIYADGTASLSLRGGTFENKKGESTAELLESASIEIVSGYLADPADWETTNASRFIVYPNTFDIVFLSADGTEIYRENIAVYTAVVNWPETPVSPGEEYRWWGWVDAAGDRYDTAATFSEEKTLTATYIKDEIPEDPSEDPEVDPGEDPAEDPITPDPVESPEKPSTDPVTVTTYDELKVAINAGEPYILVASDIVFPSGGTLNITEDTYLEGEDGVAITGAPDIFRINSGNTVTLENLNITSSGGKVLKLGPSTVNVVSGTFSAPDDAVFGGNASVLNLYGGTFVEKTGNDGPIYGVTVVYKNHTKDKNADRAVVEVGVPEVFTVILYDGEEIYKKMTVSEDDALLLPEITSEGFLGWFDEEGVPHYSGAVSGDLTLFAKYKSGTVVVSFVVDGNTTSTEVAIGTMLCEVDGSDLAARWKNADGESVSSAMTVSVDLTLYADEDYETVTTLEELISALGSDASTILIDAEIPVTETVVINRAVTLSATERGLLVRPDDFTDFLLSIEGASVVFDGVSIDGREVEAECAAVSADSDSTFSLYNTTIENNWNMSESSSLSGGAIYTAGVLNIYEGTTICSNRAYLGGGIYVDCEDNTAVLNLMGGDICHNQAGCSSSCEGAGGGIHIDDCRVENYVALYMYGGRIHHNKAEETGFTSYGRVCYGGGVSLTCGDDGIHFIQYGGSITDNYATGSGGGVYTACSSMVMYGGVMARNVALQSGGAVSTDCCDNTFYMYGGVITLNASGEGGAVDSTHGGAYELYGNIYGNYALTSGDDVNAMDTNWSDSTSLRKVNDSILFKNPYASDEMQPLFEQLAASRPTYNRTSLIDGYELNSDLWVKFIGWFDDNGNNNKYTIHRYVATDSPIDVLSRTDSFELEKGEDVKAVYGGYVLVYDANNGTGEYMYDSETYFDGETKRVDDCMFTYEGYRFLGWNTQADGTGLWYYPDMSGYRDIRFDSNKLLFAQWEKLLKVTYVVEADEKYGLPEDSTTPVDGTEYVRNEWVTIADDLTTMKSTAVADGVSIPGVWTFISWDTEDFKITEDTTVTGGWKFTPDLFTVTYVIDGDADYGVPKDSSAPVDETNYNYNDTVTVADPLSTTQDVAFVDGAPIAGTWEFVPWDRGDFAITENTTITGAWKFTPIIYTVTYVVEPDETYGVPDDSVIPVDDKEYFKDAAVTVAASLTTVLGSATVDGKTVSGTWSFSGWDTEDFNILEDTVIRGSWKFTPRENSSTPTPTPERICGNLTIEKTVSGDLGDRTQAFTFTVYFDADGSYDYSGSKSGTIANGGTIELKHGESVTIKGLPSGIHYTVMESNNAGYQVTESGSSGTIPENATVTASFVNYKSSVPYTGDRSNRIFWGVIMGFSILGLGCNLMVHRRNKDEE